MKKLILLFTTLLMFGCDGMFDEGSTNMDALFTNGFNMKLEQVYVISVNNVVLDTLFVGGTNVVDITDFKSYNNTNDTSYYQPMFTALSKNETWQISKHVVERYTTTNDLGVGMTTYSYTTPQIFQYNTITCDNTYTNRKFIIGYCPGVPILQFPTDYRGFGVMNYPITNNDNYISTNLYMVSHENNGYIYFDTNSIVKMSYQVTKPLTGDEVKLEISKGNYTLYIYNNRTTYKIGNNLYIPRYNSYVYFACVAGNGTITSYSNTFYRLKFKII